MNIKLSSIVLTVLVISILYACKKNELRSTETFLPEGKSFVKFYLLSPNTPNLIIKANEEKINNSTSGFGGVFPSTINFPDYAAIPSSSTIKFALPYIGTGNDSLVLFTNQINLEAQKFYSVTLADTGIDRTQFVILDDNSGALPLDSFYNIRLVHAMAKSPNLSLIRVDSTTSTSFIRDTIIKNIAFKAASSFVTVPVYSKRVGTSSSFHSFVRYRLIISSTGVSLGNLVTPTQTTAINQRNTSIYASGFFNGVSGSLVPQLSSIVYNK
jgi:hypothetical protein